MQAPLLCGSVCLRAHPQPWNPAEEKCRLGSQREASAFPSSVQDRRPRPHGGTRGHLLRGLYPRKENPDGSRTAEHRIRSQGPKVSSGPSTRGQMCEARSWVETRRRSSQSGPPRLDPPSDSPQSLTL